MAFNIPLQWGAGRATPLTAPLTWTRPSDWPVITDAPNEVQFLVSDAALLVYAIKTSFTRPGSENLYINWGDGTIDTVTTNTNTWTQHTYTAGTGTVCSRGYTTWKVRVYTDAGCVITESIVDSNSGAAMPQIPNVVTNTTGVLEVYFGNGVQIASFGSYFTVANRGVTYNYLEYVKFASDCSYNTVDGSFFNSTFDVTISAAAMNLGKVVMPITTGSYAISYAGMFNGCVNLYEVTLPQTTVVSSFNSTFFNTKTLQSVTFPTNVGAYDSLTTTTNMFSSCYLLTTLNNFPLALPAVTTVSGMFANCSSLTSILIPRLGTTAGGSINTSTMFNTCSNLRSVVWAGDYTSGTPIKFDSAASMFASCDNLQSLRFPEGLDFGNCTSIFSECRTIKSVIFPSTATGISNMTTAFINCRDLQEYILPATLSVSVTFSSAFSGCLTLENGTFPQGGTISSLSSTFNNCTNLKSVTLPTSLASCTSLSATFNNCYSLQQVVFPTNLSACTSMANTFASASSLKYVTLPTNLNACTSMSSMFNGCTSLIGPITFPALPLVTTFASTFAACRSLDSVTFSTTSTLVSTFNACFQNCQVLETVVFPSTQMTGMTTAASVTSLFNNCASLKSVTNMDKLGGTGNATLFEMATTGNTFIGIYSLTTTISISPRLSRFSCNGNSTTINKVTGVRFLATAASQWTGASPQINVSYTSMATAAIVQMFTDMAAQGNVTSKTVDITGSVGASGLSAADRLIVTSKGWTITG